jgi:hypothetical protein
MSRLEELGKTIKRANGEFGAVSNIKEDLQKEIDQLAIELEKKEIEIEDALKRPDADNHNMTDHFSGHESISDEIHNKSNRMRRLNLVITALGTRIISLQADLEQEIEKNVSTEPEARQSKMNISDSSSSSYSSSSSGYNVIKASGQLLEAAYKKELISLQGIDIEEAELRDRLRGLDRKRADVSLKLRELKKTIDENKEQMDALTVPLGYIETPSADVVLASTVSHAVASAASSYSRAATASSTSSISSLGLSVSLTATTATGRVGTVANNPSASATSASSVAPNPNSNSNLNSNPNPSPVKQTGSLGSREI